MQLVPVLLCGGLGTRLWPLSRSHLPKQFLPLVSDRTMLQETAARLNGLGAAAPIAIAAEEHRFLVAEQLREMSVAPQAMLLEPAGRGTAAAIAAAAHLLQDRTSLMLVLSADHAISGL